MRMADVMAHASGFDGGGIAEDLCGMGCDDRAIAAVSLALQEVVDLAKKAKTDYVISYCLRNDGRLSVDVLHYKSKQPRITKKYLSTTRSLMSGLYLIKNFPKAGYTLRLISDVNIDPESINLVRFG